MIDPEKRAKIIRIYAQDRSGPTTIGKEVGVHHSTVKKALRDAGIEPEAKDKRPRMVDPYMEVMKKKLEDYPEMDASRLYGIVKRLGYPGRGDHFRAIVAEIRPKKRAEAYLRLKTLPGEQAQVDWGSFGTLKVGRATRKLSAFAMVLSYSRQLYLKFYFGQGMSPFLAAHQEGFEFLGGCVLDVLYDNLKTAVTERIGPAIRFNPTMLSFSGHYGFNPKPVTVARGNEKGRVERVIQYVRRAFFRGR